MYKLEEIKTMKYLRISKKLMLLNLVLFLNHLAKRKLKVKNQIMKMAHKITKMHKMKIIDLKSRFKLVYRFWLNLKK